MTKGLFTTLTLTGALILGARCAKRNLEINYINIPGGYKTTVNVLPILNILAGIHAGTTKFGFKIENGEITRILAEGNYDIRRNPRSIEKIAKTADINKDGKISYDEAEKLQMFLYSRIIESYLNK